MKKTEIPITACVAGVLRGFGNGFHFMTLEGAPDVPEEGVPRSPLVVVSLESTVLRARAATLMGSRVRVHGSVEAEGVPVDNARGARVVADVLFRAGRLEDLEPPSERRTPEPPPRRTSRRSRQT